jgi:elongation factor G
VVPNDHVGSVMSDLSARRGRLLGTEEAVDDRAAVRAAVPQSELLRYAVDLRGTTHGTGTFSRTFAHYEPMPEDLARKVEHRG